MLTLRLMSVVFDFTNYYYCIYIYDYMFRDSLSYSSLFKLQLRRLKFHISLFSVEGEPRGVYISCVG